MGNGPRMPHVLSGHAPLALRMHSPQVSWQRWTFPWQPSVQTDCSFLKGDWLVTPQFISKYCQLQSSGPDLGWDWARAISVITKSPRVLGTWNLCHGGDGNTLQGRECNCVHVGWGAVKGKGRDTHCCRHLPPGRVPWWAEPSRNKKRHWKTCGGKARMETSERHKAPSSSRRLQPHQSRQTLGAFWGPWAGRWLAGSIMIGERDMILCSRKDQDGLCDIPRQTAWHSCWYLRGFWANTEGLNMIFRISDCNDTFPSCTDLGFAFRVYITRIFVKTAVMELRHNQRLKVNLPRYSNACKEQLFLFFFF